MNGNVALWLAIIGCYVSVLGSYLFVFKVWGALQAGWGAKLADLDEKGRAERRRIYDKVDEISKQTARIEGRLNERGG